MSVSTGAHSSRVSTRTDRKGRLAYLCLQATRQGQASYTHVHEIVAGLRGLGWEVDLLEPAHSPDRSASMRTKLWTFARIQQDLARRLAGYDALYIRSHPLASPAAVAARIKKIPLIVEINGTFQDVYVAYPGFKRLAPLFEALMRKTLGRANAVVAVTPQLAEWVRAFSPRTTVHVIPNAANTELFKPGVPPSKSIPRPYVLFFGALARWQGIDVLLEAVDHADWPDEVTLAIAGDGTGRDQVERSVAAGSRVCYLGVVPYQVMPSVVANCLAGVAPFTNPLGRADTGLSPLKVYETLACAVPIIVTEFPGVADLVREHACGLVIPPYRADALARAVARLWNQSERRQAMGRRGRTIVEDAHSWRSRALDTERSILAAIREASS